MGRGTWTYRRTYKSTGCCGGPGCFVMMLTMPLWPIIGCVASINEKRSTAKDAFNSAEKSDNSETVSEKED